MKKVLVTGASGFIGRHCLPVLESLGYEVHAVSSKPAPQDSSAVRWHTADLLKSEQSAALMARVRPTHLLHFAWVTAPAEYKTSLENRRWLEASLGLVREFARCGGGRVVTAGTCAEYDWRGGYCSERTTPLLPATLYGVSKHSFGTALDEFSAQAGIRAARGRLFFVYGPHESQDRLVPSVTRALLDGRTADCFHGDHVRDFLYVRDAAEAFTALLESDFTGAVNIASGKPVTVKEVVSKIAQKLGCAELVRFYTTPAAEDISARITADVTRLREDIGWQPRYDWDRGLEETLEWWDRQLSGRKNVLR